MQTIRRLEASCGCTLMTQHRFDKHHRKKFTSRKIWRSVVVIQIKFFLFGFYMGDFYVRSPCISSIRISAYTVRSIPSSTQHAHTHTHNQTCVLYLYTLCVSYRHGKLVKVGQIDANSNIVSVYQTTKQPSCSRSSLQRSTPT